MIFKKATRVLALLLAVTMMALLCACSANGEARATLKATKTVATAGEMDIPYENLYFLAMNQIADMKDVYGENVFDDPAKVDELKAFVNENLFGYTEAMILIGEEYGLDLEEGELADNVQSYVDTMLANQYENNWESYIEMLDAGYQTDHYLRTYIGVSEFLTDAIVQKMRMNGEIDDSEEAAKALFNSEKCIRVYQVVIDPIAARLTDEEAKAKAEKLRADVLAVTDNSARNRAMRNAIQSSVTGGELYILRDEYDADFEARAFGLEEYGVSEVFATDDGYRFLMRVPKEAEYLEKYLEDFRQQSYYVTLNRMAQELIDSTSVEMTRFGKSLDLLDLPEIKAEGGEWVDTLVAVIVIVAVVGLVVAVVVLLPDRSKKSRKGKRIGSKGKNR